MRTKTPTTFNSLSKAADALKSTLVDYTFAEVNNTKSLGPGHAIDKFDGICGLGLIGISDDGVPTTLQSRVSSGNLSENIFVSYIGTGGTGELVIGGVDPAHYTGEFRYLPVQNMVPGRMGYWEVKMYAWNIGGVAIGYTDKTAMDSGTSLLAVPSDAIKVLAKAVGAKEVLSSRIAAGLAGQAKPH